jgi:signal transduction histidine kinase
MGRRLPARQSVIFRLAGIYLVIFACVLAALSAVAYVLAAREYAGLLQPALGTPEAAAGYATAMRRVLFTILAFDIPLLAIVGLASYALARASISPLLLAQEQQRQFAMDAAHELRSPLATIATVAQAAAPGAPEESARAFTTITRAALDASSLIADLLVLARDPHPALLQREAVDLASVVTTCAAEFEPRARAQGIALTTDAKSAIVNGDELRLREMARNLLENAIRHARSRVIVRSYEDGRFAHLEVEDDGEGVPPELRERIFERFFRSAQDGKGSGLGLTIVRWVARAHGGEVGVHDRATFDAKIPKL